MGSPIMLWETNRYDGPLSGIAEYQGKKVWFDVEEWGGYENVEDIDKLSDKEKEDIFKESDGTYTICRERTYTLYELSPEEIAFEEGSHEMFSKYVGKHCNHTNDSEPFDGNMDRAQTFYDWAKEQSKPNYWKNKRLGTFSESQLGRHQRPWLSKQVNTEK